MPLQHAVAAQAQVRRRDRSGGRAAMSGGCQAGHFMGRAFWGSGNTLNAGCLTMPNARSANAGRLEFAPDAVFGDLVRRD